MIKVKPSCEISGHQNVEAFGHVTWGLYSEYQRGRPHQAAHLCQECSDELWEKSKALVNLQLMHYVINPPIMGSPATSMSEHESSG